MKILCAEHGKELILAGEPMIFAGASEWKCPTKGCPVKVGVAEFA